MLTRRQRLILFLVVWAAFGLLLLIGGKVKAEQSVRLAVTLNCDDIQAIARWKGWEELERRARAAGASQAQIEAAKRCLPR